MNWECPFCGAAQVVSGDTSHRTGQALYLKGVDGGFYGVRISSVVCANKRCRQLCLWFGLYKRRQAGGTWELGDLVEEWRLRPESEAKPQPDFIPEALRADYYEACRIRDLSPKASATLARRCLQGMVRDFCDVKKGSLKAEIDALRKAVDESAAPAGVTPETVDGIDHVRRVGNIGAHMEKDVNLVIDVEPQEAQLLIGVIEMLFKEWYIAREARQQHLERLKALGAAKEAGRHEAPAHPAPEDAG